MQHNLHVTRARDWIESRDAPVRIDEWLSLVRSEGDEWRVLTELEVKHPETGEVVGKHTAPEGEPFTLWLGTGTPIKFLYIGGRITVPGKAVEKTEESDPVFRKLQSIARRLEAHIVDDDNQRYHAYDEPPRPAAEAAPPPPPPAPPPPETKPRAKKTPPPPAKAKPTKPAKPVKSAKEKAKAPAKKPEAPKKKAAPPAKSAKKAKKR